jgi:hypothetical protein
MSTPKTTPAKADDKQGPTPPDEDPGTNAVEHEPDPKAEPIPDGEHRYIPRSPYTTGND